MMNEDGFGQFARQLVDGLGIEMPESVAATTGLHDDLGLDSIQLFQALMVIEDLANSEIASTEVPALDTLGDAFAYYQQLCSSALSTSGTK